jgi:hypothetical protein
VFRGLNRLLVAALVAGAACVAPSTAFADCGGGPSAQHVYSECVSGASGGKPTKPVPGSSQPSGPPTISSHASHALKRAGKDARTLQGFLHGSGRRVLPSSHTGNGTGPSALGSAFDLGSGPLALLAILGGTALLLLGGSGMRLWRARHRV